MFLVQVNFNDGCLDELIWVGVNRDVGESHFLDACNERISNWDEYTTSDVDSVLDDGYAESDSGCIVFIDTSHCISDEELMTQLAQSCKHGIVITHEEIQNSIDLED